MVIMAIARKKTKRKKNAGKGWLYFWLTFFIAITILFISNLDRIKDTLQETRILDRLTRGTGRETEPPVPELEHFIQNMDFPVLTNNENAQTAPNNDASQTTSGTAATPATTTTTTTTTAIEEKPKPAITEAKTVERSVYLMKVDNAGTMVWTKVKRPLPASDSPLLDSLTSLIKGPSAEEEKLGIISLIPKNVKILNATVRGNTAYISFSEDFLFNTYGTEGYASQRRQIVLTATEFSNVKDVQILIDGKRIDYLGEGVWIGSPISRTML